jgi:SAM-dependent methyltransferase
VTVPNLIFRAMYRLGFKPWDTGISPPELKALVEGPDRRTPGRALDLGCGTGTNAIYMARHGWEVTAIDFVPRAIATARRRAQEVGVRPRLLCGDVTRLKELGVGDGYALAFDQGCFHSIPEDRRDAYVTGLTAATLPGAEYLMWGFYANQPNPLMRTSVTKEELERRFGGSWDLLRSWGGEQPGRFAGGWYHLRRR